MNVRHYGLRVSMVIEILLVTYYASVQMILCKENHQGMLSSVLLSFSLLNVDFFLLCMTINCQHRELVQSPAMAARRNRHPGIADFVDFESDLRKNNPGAFFFLSLFEVSAIEHTA